MNILIEFGADLTKRNDAEMNCFDEIIKTDNLDLLECVYSYTRLLKRGGSSSQVGDSLLTNTVRVRNTLAFCISLLALKALNA